MTNGSKFISMQAVGVANAVIGKSTDMLNPTVKDLETSFHLVDEVFLMKIGGVTSTKKPADMFRSDAQLLQTAFTKKNRTNKRHSMTLKKRPSAGSEVAEANEEAAMRKLHVAS